MSRPSVSEGQLAEVFRHFVDLAHQAVGRGPGKPVPTIRYSSRLVDLRVPGLGALFEDAAVLVPMGEPWLMRGIAAVEAFKLFLPASLTELPQAADLAWAFAYQHLAGADRRRWIELWRRLSRPTRIGDLEYDPVRALTWLVELSGGRGLVELLRGFEELSRYQLSVGFEEFARSVEDFIASYHVPLTAREAKLIDALLRDPNLSMTALARQTNINYSTTSATVASLRRRHILYLQPAVLLSRLGYRTHYLYLLPRLETRATILETLCQSPLLFSLIRFFDGPGGYIATFATPSTPEADRQVEQLRAVLRPKCLPECCLLFTRVRRHRHINFRSYSWENGTWEINWTVWALWLRKVLDEKGFAEVLPPSEEDEDQAVSVDDRDLALLAEVWKEEWHVRPLRQKLGMGQNQLVARLRRLREAGVISNYVAVRYIGLNETAYLLVRGSPPETRPLITALDELPLHVTAEVTGDIEGLLAILYLPRGHTSALAHQLRQHLPHLPLEIHLGDQIPLAHWQFPTPGKRQRSTDIAVRVAGA